MSRRRATADTNNSDNRLYETNRKFEDDTKAIALTREPDLLVAPRIIGNNAEKQKLDEILRVLNGDSQFQKKYCYRSLFLIGSGSYGYVFRVVSNAFGPVNNPTYSEEYVRYLQVLRKVKTCKKAELLDSYRDSLCLDLVAMKVEVLTKDDIQFNSSNKIQLVKEFCMLTELFKNNSSTNALVGFPLPIEFGFVGAQRVAKNLRSVLVFDKFGKPSNYTEAFMEYNSMPHAQSPTDVTNISYFTMELVGPNLDEWKNFFAPRHSQNGKMVFSVQTTLKLMDQVLCRLLIMHRKNMVHLDLKPDNVSMGIGKMCNTVYLLDYGLSKVCSDERPTITMGSRRYMSVGVLNFLPANYMMDLESWFYVLIALLTDFVPWSDEVLVNAHAVSKSSEVKASHEYMVQLVTQLKMQFWGDDGLLDKKLFQTVTDRAEMHHKNDVPDIKSILTSIYTHVNEMRKDFYTISAIRMHADIVNDESDLFKRYKTLRKLLLFPYDCDFTLKGSCFANDKDLLAKQEKRRNAHSMLLFADYGRNWQWDWDVWFDESNHREIEGVEADNRSNKNPWDLTAEEEAPEEHANELGPPRGMPAWMKHYLARVLGHMEKTTTPSPSQFSYRPVEDGVLVA